MELQKAIRLRNVIIHDIPEKESNSMELMEMITEWLKNSLRINISSNEIGFVYRLRKKRENKMRLIKFGLVTT